MIYKGLTGNSLLIDTKDEKFSCYHNLGALNLLSYDGLLSLSTTSWRKSFTVWHEDASRRKLGASCNSNQRLHGLFYLKPQHFRCSHPSTLRRSHPLRNHVVSNSGSLKQRPTFAKFTGNSQFLSTILPDFVCITYVQDCTWFIQVSRFNNMLHVFHCCICYIDHSLPDRASFCVCIRKMIILTIYI